MGYRLNADETACVKTLAERFEKNEVWVEYSGSIGVPNSLVDPLGLPAEKRDAILSLMEEMGVITEVTHTMEGRFHFFRISPSITQIARMIAKQETKKEEPRDIVEEVKTVVRSHRVLAWAIIVFFALTGLATFLNQLLQLLKGLGVTFGSPTTHP